MYMFSEEGKFQSDLSGDPLIPGGMCQTSFFVQDGRVYAEGESKLKGKFELRMEVFDGAKWSLL